MKFLVRGEDFVDMIQAVQRATAKDDARPVLSGIHLHIEGDTVTAVACDGYRLSTSSARELSGKTLPRITVILQKAPLLAFLKLINKKKDSPILFGPGAGNDGASAWLFEGHLGSLNVPLIDGTYPDWRQIAGGNGDTLTTLFAVNAKMLGDALAVHGQEMVTISVVPGGPKDGSVPLYVQCKEDHLGMITRHVVMPMMAGAR